MSRNNIYIKRGVSIEKILNDFELKQFMLEWKHLIKDIEIKKVKYCPNVRNIKGLINLYYINNQYSLYYPVGNKSAVKFEDFTADWGQ